MTKITQHDEGDDTILNRSATVMTLTGSTNPWNHLINFREASWTQSSNPDNRRVVKIPYAVWMEMGAPEEITVTIEPGDTLNAVEENG